MLKKRAKIADYANLEVDIYEKTIKISASDEFYKEKEKRRKNILLHELVHSRINIFNKWKEKLTDELEEELANDITRGFERFKNAKTSNGSFNKRP